MADAPIFLKNIKEAENKMEQMEELEEKLIGSSNDVEDELEEAKKQRRSHEHIDNLEDKLIQIKAQVEFVGQDTEAALKERDQALRPKLSCQMDEEKRLTTNQNDLFKSSLAIHITDSNDDFDVSYTKHTYNHHISFQFDIKNQLTDQEIEQVTVQMDDPTGGFKTVHCVPCVLIGCNHSGTTYTLVTLPDDSSAVTGTLSCKMKFQMKEYDPKTGQLKNAEEEPYPDEFVLENVKVTISDHVQKVLKPNWSALWEEIGIENEFEYNFTLSISTLEECVKKIADYFGMQSCEESDKVVEGKASHTLYLIGIYRGGHDVLAQAQMALEKTSANTRTISVQLTVRSSDRSAVQAIASYILKQNIF